MLSNNSIPPVYLNHLLSQRNLSNNTNPYKVYGPALMGGIMVLWALGVFIVMLDKASTPSATREILWFGVLIGIVIIVMHELLIYHEQIDTIGRWARGCRGGTDFCPAMILSNVSYSG
jgi:hypothetical protein